MDLADKYQPVVHRRVEAVARAETRHCEQTTGASAIRHYERGAATMAIQELIATSTAIGERNPPSQLGIVNRLGAASGVVGFVLAIGAIFVSASTGTIAANPGAGVDEIARAYGNVASPMVWIGAYLQVLGFLLLFGFLTYVGTVVARDSSSTTRWLANLATGAGQGFVLVTLVGFAIGGVTRYRAGPDIDLSVAMALFDVHVAIYVVSWALSVVFLLASAAQGVRSHALPVWLSVAAVLFALVNLAAVAGPTTPLASFPNLLMWLWTVAASVTLIIRPVRRSLCTAPD